jgi:hypothetical protein
MASGGVWSATLRLAGSAPSRPGHVPALSPSGRDLSLVTYRPSWTPAYRLLWSLSRGSGQCWCGGEPTTLEELGDFQVFHLDRLKRFPNRPRRLTWSAGATQPSALPYRGRPERRSESLLVVLVGCFPVHLISPLQGRGVGKTNRGVMLIHRPGHPQLTTRRPRGSA